MSDGATMVADRVPSSSGTVMKQRFLGVDVARGVALFAMLAANTFDVLDSQGRPTLAVETVIGRSATMFAMVAGVSLAFITGGRHPVQGLTRRAVSAGLAVRALLIAAIGLTISYGAPDGFSVILPYYGVCFLLAIPLVGLRPRTLAYIASGLVVVGPLLLLGATSLGWDTVSDTGPTLSDLFGDPGGFLVDNLFTGDFPVAVYMIYILTGLAIGRLDLTSKKVAVRLLAGGLALAVAAWEASSVLLFHLGGMQHLGAAADPGLSPEATRNEILWDPDRIPSWWWLALRAHHSGTPFDAMHTLGCALAVLGAVLLLMRLRVAQRLLWPIGVAGTMTLTLYSAQVLFLGTNLLGDNNWTLYLVTAGGALVFALIWNRFIGQGPLEKLVAVASRRARLATMARLTRRRSEPELVESSSG
jgi:uncharacterized membrane protein